MNKPLSPVVSPEKSPLPFPLTDVEASQNGISVWAEQVRAEEAANNPIITQVPEESKAHQTGLTEQTVSELDSPRQELENELERIAPVLARARTEYARTAAGRSKGTLRFGDKKQFTFGEAREFSKEALEYEKGLYEKVRNKTMGLELELARLSNVSEENLGVAAEVAAAVDAGRLSRELSNQQKLAAGGYKQKLDENGQPVSDFYGIPELELVKPLGRFKEFWGRRSGAKFLSRKNLEKTLVLAVPSAAVGMGASVLLAPAIAGGVIGGAAVAGMYGAIRVTRTLVATRLNNHSKLTIADDQAKADQQYLDSVARQDVDSGLSEHKLDQDNYAEIVAGDANSDVKANRRALGAAALAIVSGTGAGEALGHILGVEHHSSAHSSSHGVKRHHEVRHRAHHHHGRHHSSKGVTLKLHDLHAEGQNDSISQEVSGYMNHHGYNGNNVDEVNKVTQAVLRHQHISWSGAHDLPVGYTFHIPHEILEEATKKNKI